MKAPTPQHQEAGVTRFTLQRQYKGAKAPKAPEPIPPVSASSTEVAQAETEARRAKAQRKGYSSTLLGAGDTGGAQTEQKTLLG